MLKNSRYRPPIRTLCLLYPFKFSQISYIKSIFSIFALLSLAACGSGGSGSGADESAMDNGYRIVPFSPETCQQHDAHIWKDGECLLEANPTVKNLAAIHSLPQQDKDDVIRWLVSLEKKANLHSIVPNWDASSSVQPDAEDSTPYLDEHLLKQHVENGIISDGSRHWMLGEADVNDSLYANLVLQESEFLNGQAVTHKKIALNIDDGIAQLLINEREIYTFSLMQSVSLIADIALNTVSDVKSFDIDYRMRNDGNFQEYDFESLLTQVQSQLAFTDDGAEDLAQYLNISIENANQYFKKTMTPFTTARVNIQDERAFNLHADDPRLAKNIENTPPLFDSQIESLGVVAHIDARQVLGEKVTPIEVKLSAVLSRTAAGLLTVQVDSTLSVLELSSYERTLSTFTDVMMARANHIRSAYSEPFTPALPDDAGRHALAYQPLLLPLLVHLPEKYESPVNAMLDNSQLSELLFEKVHPPYAGDQVPTYKQRVSMIGWDSALMEAIIKSLRPDSSEDLMRLAIEERLGQFRNKVEQVTQLSGSESSFILSLIEQIEPLLLGLDEHLLNVYLETIVNITTKMAYLNLNLEENITVQELHSALNRAGLWLAEPLKEVLNKVYSFQYVDDRWNPTTTSMIATNDVISLPDALDALPNAKTLFAEHDVLAQELNIPLATPQFFSKQSELVHNEKVKDKIVILKALKSFYVEDQQNQKNAISFKHDFQLLSSTAYKDEWDEHTFVRLQTQLRLIWRYRFCTGKGSISETWACYPNKESLLSNQLGQGYLADYGNNQNPYVDHADQFKTVRELSEQLYANGLYAYEDVLLSKYYNGGLWLTCSIAEVDDLLTELVNKLSDLVDWQMDHSEVSRENIAERASRVEEIKGIYVTQC